MSTRFNLFESDDLRSDIIKEEVSMTPKVISVKFTSNDHAEAFVRRHAGTQNFLHKYKGFWYSGNQTPEERDHYKQYLESLFRVKRAICSCTSIGGAHVVIIKIDKNICFPTAPNSVSSVHDFQMVS